MKTQPKDETAVLNYAKWMPIYEKEIPYQIISVFPGTYQKTNLVFEPAPVPEVITDISGQRISVFGRFSWILEMESLLKRELQGVDEVFFDDWRGIQEMDLKDNSQYLLPVGNAHIDQSAAGVLKHVHFHMGDRATTLLGGRVRAANVRRPTPSWPVQDKPLELCDGSSVGDSDLLPTDHIKKSHVGQTSNLMYRPGFRWFCLSEQRKDE
ncbi:hypothetical protein DL95DRAFT_424973 [Leptodontidium sp. 2 PMI_412]|nr:hypothetical protein DL95DRAFT_424973 [Leptodontidium sp. 2 PMI_412]